MTNFILFYTWVSEPTHLTHQPIMDWVEL